MPNCDLLGFTMLAESGPLLDHDPCWTIPSGLRAFSMATLSGLVDTHLDAVCAMKRGITGRSVSFKHFNVPNFCVPGVHQFSSPSNLTSPKPTSAAKSRQMSPSRSVPTTTCVFQHRLWLEISSPRRASLAQEHTCHNTQANMGAIDALHHHCATKHMLAGFSATSIP